MLFRFLYAYVIMALVILVNAATQPGETCFNPTWKQYASFSEFAKEFASKFDNTDLTGQGDAKDGAQAFVCANQLLKWMKTLGSDYYTLEAYNWTSKTIRAFGQDIQYGQIAKGKIFNDKGYFFWRENNICYMTKFKNNSSWFFNENVFIKDNQQIYGGSKRRNGNKNCAVVEVDNELCNGSSISWEQEAYVMGKWGQKMKACATA